MAILRGLCLGSINFNSVISYEDEKTKNSYIIAQYGSVKSYAQNSLQDLAK